MKRKQIAAIITAMTIVLGTTAYGSENVSADQENKERTEIESTLNISNNDEITWSYDSQSDSWTMSVTCAVANPELPDYQGISVNVPGAYVKGIDTDGDGNNIVDLYNPINYIGNENTESPTWTRIVMGASEGDMSLFASMNMQIAWLNSGTDAELEWQWDGGHVPSEIFGESLALYVDEMYGKYVEGASKATPGFDVMDYGQETYEFGSSTQDARHFDKYVLKVLQEDAEILSELFTG